MYAAKNTRTLTLSGDLIAPCRQAQIAWMRCRHFLVFAIVDFSRKNTTNASKLQQHQCQATPAASPSKWPSAWPSKTAYLIDFTCSGVTPARRISFAYTRIVARDKLERHTRCSRLAALVSGSSTKEARRGECGIWSCDEWLGCRPFIHLPRSDGDNFKMKLKLVKI